MQYAPAQIGVAPERAVPTAAMLSLTLLVVGA
jgi:hypothetical protein